VDGMLAPIFLRRLSNIFAALWLLWRSSGPTSSLLKCP
jgi:hypothetical protein